MNEYGKFRALLAFCLLMIVSIKAQAEAAVFWQQQHYQPIFFDFNRDQTPDLLLQAKSEAVPSLLVLGEYSRSEVMFPQKNSIELPAKISGMAWSVADAQLLPLRNSTHGTSGLLVIFPKQHRAFLLPGAENNFDFSQPIAKFQSSQWPFLAKVSDFELHAGDFDNDGVDEILQLGKISGEHEILKIQSNYSLFSKQKIKKKVAWGLRGKARIIVRDFDNDGAADIFALAKSPGSSHYLMMSDKTGQLKDVDGQAVPPTIGGMPWFDESSGTLVVKLLDEQRPVLLRFYNYGEAKTSGDDGCIGWLYDPLQKTSQEYCPDAKTPEQGGGAKLAVDQLSRRGITNLTLQALPKLEDCPIIEFSSLASQNKLQLQNSWCPPPVPQTPISPPQIGSGSYAVNQIFDMQLPNTWDLSALTYDVWAVKSGVYSNIAGAMAPGGNFSLPSVTASGKLEAVGTYQVMYRSCNGEGCSGFGPGTTVNIYNVPVMQLVSTHAGTGGTISPTSQSVPYGSTATFTITPNIGFIVSNSAGCDGVPNANPYTTGRIYGPCMVNARFTPITHLVSTVAGTGGSISPTSRTVAQGSTTTFTVSANSGFTANRPTGCGTGTWVNNIYTTAAITGACTVNATFTATAVNHMVSATAGTGGSISPTSRAVSQGSTTSFTVTANSGFTANKPTGCGNGSWVNNIYTTAAITGACTVNATFTATAVNHLVSATAGTGGSISPTSRIVPQGNTTSFTVTANSGFTANKPTGCGNGSWVNNIYTTAAITGACTVNATFTARAVNHLVSATAGAGGRISPTSRTVPQGSTTTFAVTANSGFTANPPTGCNGSLVGNTYTTGVINEPCIVSATFKAATPTAQVVFLHTDVLGSVIAETDANGVVIKKTEYKPFGQSIDN